MKSLSLAAQSLWAKKSKSGEMLWLPLVQHLADSAAIANKLWNHWLSPGVRKEIAAGVNDPDQAEDLFVFLAAAHDIGKATPVFQAKNTGFKPGDLDYCLQEKLVFAGLPMKPFQEFTAAGRTPHALATQFLLEREGCPRNVSIILGAHHGKPPDKTMLLDWTIEAYEENYYLEKEGQEQWSAVQGELVSFALELSGINNLKELPIPCLSAQVLLSGLVVIADWIASNESYLHYFRPESPVFISGTEKRAQSAWNKLNLPPLSWPPYDMDANACLYAERFDFEMPNAVQESVLDVAKSIQSPGILILEAPMGVGKTEAALAASEIFSFKAQRSGLFFALPTQATSNAIFPRLLKWTGALETEGRYSVKLAHGKAQYNKDFRRLFEGGTNVAVDEDEKARAVALQWFEGNKKSLLADFVVGTIDQLLLAALRQKHVMLRHLGLAGKVVIIDECHAYDAYMSRYLEMALRWLGAYRVPVIVLSATLTASKRLMLMEAYLNRKFIASSMSDPLSGSNIMPTLPPEWITSRGYPAITYSDGREVRQRIVADTGPALEVTLELLPDYELVCRLRTLLSGGGCAGVVVNTVDRAQKTAAALREVFGGEAITLLHSQFITPDRVAMEEELLSHIGKGCGVEWRSSPHIVVGTQVIEQSLDVDFDVLVTDLCPMDLLLQRIGRLHRHRRERPEILQRALCLVMGADSENFLKGSVAVYGTFPLMRAKYLMPQTLVLPKDIPTLTQNAYDPAVSLPIEPPGYQKAREEYQSLIKNKEERACAFRLSQPSSSADMAGWLDTDIPVTEKYGDAAVRDTDESIEVLVVQKTSEGKVSFLPWIENGRLVPAGEAPDDNTARLLACQGVRLPRVLCKPWNISRTIGELENLNKELALWQVSPLLKGELFLVLDQHSHARLCEHLLTYSRFNGLACEKEV
jgi:CRISPR-associated endonuclease/helicase Cas3